MDIGYWLRGCYVLAAVFGLGVTVVDLLGLFGSDDDAVDGDGDGHLELPAGGPSQLESWSDGSVGDADGGDGNPADGDGGVVESGGPDGTGHDHAEADGEMEAVAAGKGHTPVPGPTSLLLLLRYLRMAVYFSLGFGPIGLAALYQGATELGSLAWAVPAGVASAVIAGAVFRFQRRDVDSSVTDRELFYEAAEVTVSIAPGEMGRVRLVIGNSPVDRFARARDPADSIPKGERVYVIQVKPDYLLVERPRENRDIGP